MTTTFQFSLDLLAAKKNLSKREVDGLSGEASELTLESRRYAALEHLVFLEGVKVTHKQERIGYVLTLLASGVILAALYVVVKVVG
jgi:hypothetical protein